MPGSVDVVVLVILVSNTHGDCWLVSKLVNIDLYSKMYYINERENQRGNQECTIQRNKNIWYTRHRMKTNKT